MTRFHARPKPPSRRAFVAGLALGALAAPTAQAQFFPDIRDRDPIDRIPNWYSVRRFTRLSENDIYKVNLAIKRHRRIIIEGYTPSESRQIIRDASDDWPATRTRLLQGGY